MPVPIWTISATHSNNWTPIPSQRSKNDLIAILERGNNSIWREIKNRNKMFGMRRESRIWSVLSSRIKELIYSFRNAAQLSSVLLLTCDLKQTAFSGPLSCEIAIYNLLLWKKGELKSCNWVCTFCCFGDRGFTKSPNLGNKRKQAKFNKHPAQLFFRRRFSSFPSAGLNKEQARPLRLQNKDFLYFKN